MAQNNLNDMRTSIDTPMISGTNTLGLNLTLPLRSGLPVNTNDQQNETIVDTGITSQIEKPIYQDNLHTGNSGTMIEDALETIQSSINATDTSELLSGTFNNIPTHNNLLNNISTSDRTSVHHVNLVHNSSSNQVPSMMPTNNFTTMNVQLCQRMDEVSARLISVEEMITKLCHTIEHQNNVVQTLRLDNKDQLNRMSNDIKNVYSALSVSLQPRRNEKDEFVTELLNSITNISGNYLERIHSKTLHQVPKVNHKLRTDTNNLSNIIPDPQIFHKNLENHVPLSYQQNIEPIPNTQSIPNNYFEKSNQFFLNSDLIKRKKDILPENKDSTIMQQIIDNTSLINGYTMSLPNIPLDISNRQLLGKNPELLTNKGLGAKSKKSNPFNIQIGSDDNNSGSSDEGYLEDDEENKSSEDEKIVEGDYSITEFLNNMDKSIKLQQIKSQNVHINQEKVLSPKSVRRFANSNSQVCVSRSTPGGHAERLVLKNNCDSLKKLPEEEIQYTMLKAPDSVRAIWDEYTKGVDGKPSIRYMEKNFGNKWRIGKNKKTFARRKRLYKYILNGFKDGKTEDDMINALEEKRFYEDSDGEIKKRTIGWLQQSLSGIL